MGSHRSHGTILYRRGRSKRRTIIRRKWPLGRTRVKRTAWGSLRNGGFEKATPIQADYWSVSSNDIYFENDYPLFGNRYAVIALSRGEQAVLSQVTLPLHDADYKLSFWLKRAASPMNGTISISLIGSSLLPLTYKASAAPYGQWRKFVVTISRKALEPGRVHTLSIRFKAVGSNLLLHMDHVALLPK